MKVFPSELIQLKNATLNAKIFKNDFLKIPATLFYSIEINLAEIELEEQKVNTSIHLDFIRFDINQLNELENQVFEFPVNPTEGFIDGSIYLFDVHNPIDAGKIKFSKIENESIEAAIYFDIDFEYENTGYKKLTNTQLKVSLEFGKISIDTEIMNTENFDSTIANKLLSNFLSVNNYAKSQIVETEVVFKLKSQNV